MSYRSFNSRILNFNWKVVTCTSKHAVIDYGILNGHKPKKFNVISRPYIYFEIYLVIVFCEDFMNQNFFGRILAARGLSISWSKLRHDQVMKHASICQHVNERAVSDKRTHCARILHVHNQPIRNTRHMYNDWGLMPHVLGMLRVYCIGPILFK